MDFEAFSHILNTLTLNEVITCRQVCRQWKDWIDEYLHAQETLLICFDGALNQLFEVSQLFELDYDQILSKRILIPMQRFSDVKFTNSVLSMFPNIVHFYYAPLYTLPSHISYNIYRKLLHYWNANLETLMIYFGTRYSRLSLISYLNELESLETLIVLDYDAYFPNYSFPKKAKFLAGIKKLYVPSLKWIDKFNGPSTITSLGARHHQHWEQYRDWIDRKRFPNLDAFQLFVEVYNQDQGQVENIADILLSGTNKRLINWLDYLKKNGFENVRLLSFVDPDRFVPNIGKPQFNEFLKKLELFKSLTILKFDACNFDYFECILDHARFFNHVTELHVRIRFAVVPEHVDRFRKAFPSSMKSVEKVFLRPVKFLTISEDIRKVVIDRHLYQVIVMESVGACV